MKNTLFLLACGTLLLSCSSSSTQQTEQNPDVQGNPNPSSNEWSIPVSEVLDGGPGRDGIPALENPNFVVAEDASAVLRDTDLVIGFKNGNDIRAYPHIILDWHEIVNDNIDDISLAVTYCPLTGTGIGWNRIINGSETTFGVSGLLYQTNLVPFDRATLSNWSQILNESVNGNLLGEKAELIPVVETDWGTWKSMFPSTKVLSLNTGFSRTYGIYPYRDYRTNNDFFIFPTPKDDRLPLKERVHAIIDNGDAKAYRFTDVEASGLIRDSFNGKEYLVVGNSEFIISFELNGSQNTLEFEFNFDGNSEAIVQDTNGTQWNAFGEVVSGTGSPLKVSSSFMGYWFSIPAFYETALFGE